jgi:hypothetical protein
MLVRERPRIAELSKWAAAATLGWSPSTGVLVTDGPVGALPSAFSGHVLPDAAPYDTVWAKSALTVRDIGKPMAAGFHSLQEAMGGPNALTTVLGGAALGGVAGAGLAHGYKRVAKPVLNTLFPGQFDVDESNVVPLMTTLGAGLGMAPGMLRSFVGLNNGHGPLSPYPWSATKVAELVSPRWAKSADAAGALFAPRIPVDAFNRAIWSDALSPPNPFGTRGAFGSADAPLHTPPQVAAQLSGVVSAAGAMTGRDVVSPWDIARLAGSAAVNAGGSALAGSIAGLAAGKLLGALAGLTPAAQQSMRQTGLWAGALSGVARTLF